MDITTTDEWRGLIDLASRFDEIRIDELFRDDPARAGKLTLTVGDLVVDASKHRADADGLAALYALARRADLEGRIAAMLQGERINTTEDRPALHTALRAPERSVVEVDGRDVVPEVHAVLRRMQAFSDRVRDGDWRGHTGREIETVVNIGIGGSDLGPAMAYEALAARRHPRLRCRFVSNVDGTDLFTALKGLDPATTLFVVSSKTFTTQETLTNARSARRWSTDALGDDAVARHFVAVSTNEQAVVEFGIDPANMFGFWDWVGGRYSVDSAIGLSLMLAIGADAFADFLAGFRIVDEHLSSTPLERNVPVVLGLLAVWYRTFVGLPTRAVLPYSRALHRFPAYLQQLDMESNGKQVRADGSPVTYETGPIVWGEPGTIGQHSFHQLLHQGTTIVPLDFIVMAQPDHRDAELPGSKPITTSSWRTAWPSRRPWRSGVPPTWLPQPVSTRPSSPIAPSRGTGPRPRSWRWLLTPSVLGQLIALYEHQVLVQGVVWGSTRSISGASSWGRRWLRPSCPSSRTRHPGAAPRRLDQRVDRALPIDQRTLTRAPRGVHAPVSGRR
ncbi:MAG: glucose-6-phosphate isomerase [Acidimicrobiales bacterium]